MIDSLDEALPEEFRDLVGLPRPGLTAPERGTLDRGGPEVQVEPAEERRLLAVREEIPEAAGHLVLALLNALHPRRGCVLRPSKKIAFSQDQKNREPGDVHPVSPCLLHKVQKPGELTELT